MNEALINLKEINDTFLCIKEKYSNFVSKFKIDQSHPLDFLLFNQLDIHSSTILKLQKVNLSFTLISVDQSFIPSSFFSF